MLRWLRLVLTKDNAFLVMGGGGLANEFFIRTGPERETVILACLALMGVPYVRNVDKRKSNSDESTNSSESRSGTDS
jgi:hypothetical protein